MLREVGYFREFGAWFSNYPSIRDYVQDKPAEDEELILRYLESGIWGDATFAACPDVIDSNGKQGLYPHGLSDGIWRWRADLPYYVRVYHLRLPKEFVDHMRRNGWKVPGANNGVGSRS